MKQLTQNFKTGDLYVGDISPSSITEGFDFVENKYYLVSAKTDKSTAIVV